MEAVVSYTTCADAAQRGHVEGFRDGAHGSTGEVFDASLAEAEEHFVPTLREAAVAGRLEAIAALAADHLGRPLLQSYLREREQREPNVAETLMFRAGFVTLFLLLASEFLEAGDRPDVSGGGRGILTGAPGVPLGG